MKAIASTVFQLGLVLCLAGPALAVGETAQLRLQDGMSALMRGKYDQAVAYYDEAVQAGDLPAPKMASLHNDRGVAKWRLDMLDEALVDLTKAIELAPDQATTYNNRGNVLLDLDKPGEALKDFDKAVALAPGYGAAFNNRGNANLDLQRYEAALADYKRAMDLMPANAVPYNGRGKAQGALKRPYTALRYLNRAITLNGRYTAAYRNRALLLTSLDRADEAIADLDRLLTTTTDDAELYAARGAAYLALQKLPLAIKDFGQAIELDAENAPAYAGRGAAQAERTPEKAIEDLDKAVGLDADLLDARLSRAGVRLRLANQEGAAEDIAKARELDPQSAEAARLAGQLAEAKGDTAAAIAGYRDSLRLDPFQQNTQNVLDKLTGEESPRQSATTDAVADWRIVTPAQQKFVAVNPRYETLRISLEMHGSGEPKVLDWTPLSQSLAGFGLLRYAAGVAPDGKSRFEYVAVLDLKRNRVLSIEPYVWGEQKARWDWSDSGVTVTDPEGLISALELKPKADPKPRVAQPRRRWDDDNSWGWGGNSGGGRRRSPNIFDWLFR